MHRDKVKCVGEMSDVDPDQERALSRPRNDKSIGDHLHFLARSGVSALTEETLDSFLDLINQLVGSSGPVAPVVVAKGKPKHTERVSLCCTVCRGVLLGATVLSCGNAYCQRCVKRAVGVGGESDVLQTGVAVTVMAMVEKLWARDLQSAKLRNEGNRFCEQRKYAEALECYRKAENLIRDHRQAIPSPETDVDGDADQCVSRPDVAVLNAVDLGACLSNISLVLNHLKQPEDAMKKAKEAVALRPSWSKARFRLASAYMHLEMWEHALQALLLVGVLEQCVTRLRGEFKTVLRQLLTAEAAVNESRRHSEDSNKSQLDTKCVDHEENSKLRPAAKQRQESSIQFLWDGCLREMNWLKDSMDAMNESEGNYFLLQSGTFPKGSQPQETILGLKVDSGSISSSLADPEQDGPLDLTDVECPLCLRIFWEPVTTSCGHTFCQSCLYRALDTSVACPLCKSSLTQILERQYSNVTTKFVEMVARWFFPREVEERRLAYVTHLGLVTGQGNEFRLPLFVCGVALPGLLCPLHVYEPRYRLLIRRCMESGTRQFGLCAPNPAGGSGFSDFGTVMEIRDVHYFPDGRSIVETIGSRRFRVLSADMVDGYYVGDIETVQDEVPTKDSQIQGMLDVTRDKAVKWFEEHFHDKAAIYSEIGPMPKQEKDAWKTRDGPAWVWWLIWILPIPLSFKLRFLTMVSLEKRLSGIQGIISEPS
ncbi:unnamed protein product [Notodromas monacha]|uniref:LON peptidase N-terminal domain and RING finger protein 1 n=1 Tax=Notodromas monacha TaxID=399045 RepID=A0A7R9GDV9_9CRUS|nr:unnamed protein product [Notodromas monacha]CAG0918954.1 unnamed protein product [Notodromas monacha]